MRINIPLTSEKFDRRLGQALCFAGGPFFFMCGVLALHRFGATPVEFVIGLLAAIAAAMAMVILGFLIRPLT